MPIPMIPFTAFQAASERIRPHLARTPATWHAPLALALKWENHQHTRSFKPRGALNKILSLPPEKLAAGLVTGSAGNHGQGVALAAQLSGSAALVFVPQATPEVKVERMQALGAVVERVPGRYGDAEARAIAFAAETGQTFISAYNDPEVIAGAGTLALEWLEQMPELSRLLIPAGGGGLLCGVGLAAKALKPEIEIIGVLSEASPFLYQQFYHGHMNGVVELPTLTDGLAGAVEPGSITLDLLPHACDAIVQLTEAEVAAGIAYAYHELGETIEGSGAVGLAAVLAGKVPTAGKPTGALVSGGNIDPGKLAEIMRFSLRRFFLTLTGCTVILGGLLSACGGVSTPRSSPPPQIATPTPRPLPPTITLPATPNAAATRDAAAFRATLNAYQTETAARKATERAAGAATPAPVDLAALPVISPANVEKLRAFASLSQPEFLDFRWAASDQAVAVSSANELVVLPLASLATRYELPGTDFTAFTFAPAGTLLAAAHDQGKLTLLSLASGQTDTVQAHPGRVTSLAFSPDGRLLASTSETGEVKLWDPAAGRELASQTVQTYIAGVERADWAAFSPGGDELAVFVEQNSTVLIWQVEELRGGTGAPRQLAWLDHAAPVVAPVVSAYLAPDWRTLAWVGRGTLQFMDRAGNLGQSAGFQDFITGIGFTPDSSRLLIVSAEYAGDQVTGLIAVFDTQTEARLFDLKMDDFIRPWVVSSNGQGVATGTFGGEIALWDLATGQPAARFAGPAQLQLLAYSPAGDLLAAATEDGRLLLLDASEGLDKLGLKANVLADLPVSGTVAGVAFLLGGRVIATVTRGGALTLWGVTP